MLKFVTIAVVGFSLFGCASKGSVSALDERVTALEAADKVTAQEVESVKAEHAALQGNVEEINVKLDRALRKQ